MWVLNDHLPFSERWDCLVYCVREWGERHDLISDKLSPSASAEPFWNVAPSSLPIPCCKSPSAFEQPLHSKNVCKAGGNWADLPNFRIANVKNPLQHNPMVTQTLSTLCSIELPPRYGTVALTVQFFRSESHSFGMGAVRSGRAHPLHARASKFNFVPWHS